MTSAASRRAITILTASVLVAGVTLGIGVERSVLARQDGVKRTILIRADDPAGPGYEAVMGIAEIAPGAGTGKHRHYGVELAYVLEGTIVVERDGLPNVTGKAGESLKNVGVHDARNAGSAPARVLAVYLVEKGKPLAEPVK
jgi:quercetin dioxygenase-like cupin family protein